ncbi:MAG: hypothetical protein EAX96_10395 [Candidatus Lokiarchaeota archaeon]|nr:hypothetical protein [Candidatus Lokiarchaeota archaeon]
MDALSSIYCFSAERHYETSQIEMQALLSTLKRFGEFVVNDDIKHIQFSNKIFIYHDYQGLTFIAEAELAYKNKNFQNALKVLQDFLDEFGRTFLVKNQKEINLWRKTNRIDIFKFTREFEDLKFTYEKVLKRPIPRKVLGPWSKKIAERLEMALF